MNVRSTLAVTLLSLSIVAGAPAAYAGFQLTTEGEAQASAPPSYETEKGIDSSAPILKVFNERYVPDSIRKKYNLSEDWDSAGASSVAQPSAAQPVSITPVESSPKSLEEGAAPQPAIIFHPKPVQATESWRARKGESVREVLHRWSEREDVDLMWASPDTPVLQKDFSFFGKFQDAVNGLLKENGVDTLHSQYRSEGLNPVMMEPASTVTTNKPVPEQEAAAVAEQPAPQKTTERTVANFFKPEPKKAVPETRWFGLSGASLGEVLQVWAEQAGYTLVWQAEGHYALKESVSQVGTFEDAVYSALSQYDNNAVRPVGEIYTDQASGQKVLVIRTDAS